MRTILITGAAGFVGTALCNALRGADVKLRILTRDKRKVTGQQHQSDDFILADLTRPFEWHSLLKDVDCVIHLAARTHQIVETAADPAAEFRRINVDTTRALAQAAVAAGVRRFVFISSIKVNGEATAARPYSETDPARPEDDYGRSKWQAEQALLAAAAGSRMESVILRPPLLYGPGVKGNFLTLMNAVARGIPLPLASLRNSRSLLYIGSLVDAIVLCMDHPAAAGKTYLLADNSGVSTPDLVRAIAHALGRKPRLAPCPPALLKLAGRLSGRSGAISRLIGSLQVDSNRIRGELGWVPRYTLEEGLRQTAEWYYRESRLHG